MTYKPTYFLLIPGIIFLTLGCENSNKSEETDLREEETETTVNAPMTAMMITQLVEDFDTWRKNYEAEDSIRISYGISFDAIHRNLLDSNHIIITAFTKNHESARMYSERFDIKKDGILSKPISSFWDIVWTRPGGDYPKFEAHYFIFHAVKDFDNWMDKFQANDSIRLTSGLYALVIAMDADSVNDLGIYLGATSVDKANALLADSAMVTLQKKAGAFGLPNFTIVKLLKIDN